MLLSLAAWTSAGLFVLSVVMWLRSYWADNQLHWVLVRSNPSSGKNEVYGEHVRLSSSRGKLTLGFMKSRTPYAADTGETVALPSGPAIARWSWTDRPDDLAEVRKVSTKWERRYVFEYGRVIHRVKADSSLGILPGGSLRSSYLVLPWPEVVLILGALAWVLMRGEMGRRRRPWRLVHGYCVECGYDLRKSLGACPECGKGRWGLE